MKKAMRDKWVKALRSGRYRQGEGCLKGGGAYCCIGVLGKSVLRLGDEVLESELLLDPPELNKCGLTSEAQTQLANLNDDGVPFEMIAGLIATSL